MKIKQLKSQLSKAGFSRLPKRGKGSHSIWLHQRTRIKIIHPRQSLFVGNQQDRAVSQSGRNAKDAKLYQIKAVNSALKKINS